MRGRWCRGSMRCRSRRRLELEWPSRGSSRCRSCGATARAAGRASSAPPLAARPVLLHVAAINVAYGAHAHDCSCRADARSGKRSATMIFPHRPRIATPDAPIRYRPRVLETTPAASAAVDALRACPCCSKNGPRSSLADSAHGRSHVGSPSACGTWADLEPLKCRCQTSRFQIIGEVKMGD